MIRSAADTSAGSTAVPTMSPQDRLAQTSAAVSSTILPDTLSNFSASRAQGHPALGNSLIPRDYLSSTSPRLASTQQRQGEGPEPSQENITSGSTHESGGRAPEHSSQGTATLTRDDHSQDGGWRNEPAFSATSKDSVGPFADPQCRTQSPESLPESPKPRDLSTPSSKPSAPVINNMPRTSSIDSAISSASNQPWVQKPPGENKEATVEEVRNLIATAGSAENLIHHLLRDKQHAAAQNAQLWKLVDKQRALLLGLNKDLERVTKERDRYRKKAKDLLADHSTVLVGGEPELDLPLQSPTGAVVGSRDADPIPKSDLKLRNDHGTPSKSIVAQVQSSPVDPAMMPPPLHLQQQTKMQSIKTDSPGLAFSITEATPVSDKAPKSFLNSRKAPPKPLDLRPAKEEVAAAEPGNPEEAVSDEVDDEFRPSMERGRRKTREEDDHDRELAAMKELEARSRSKKEKRKNEISEALDMFPQAAGEPLHSPPIAQVKAQDQMSLSSTLSPPGNLSDKESLLSLPLRSPGLPVSPRPVGGMGAAMTLPMSPRGPGGNFPLSPRAPKQPLPMPTAPGQQAPAPEVQKKTGPSPLVKVNSNPEPDRLAVITEPTMGHDDVPQVNRGLVSPTWPDFLLPPNALPSIQIKVTSSRLRPSRNSMIGLRQTDENAVFILSIFSRASGEELWRLEKIPTTLVQLDQQLRPRCTSLPNLPERKLFSGHAPAVIDARRVAVDAYFEDLLDTPMEERAAAFICQFLSTDVLEPQQNIMNQKTEANDVRAAGMVDPGGIPTKSGYLTKKGKNFGGWKSRYFVLNSPELRYFEAPGGAHLGTIKLLNARIGRQTQSDPNATAEVDSDNQYRHAFLILEPKRKDTNSHLRHVLCAESDAERDEWVETLLHYIDEKPSDSPVQHGMGIQTSHTRDVKPSQKVIQDEMKSRQSGSPHLYQDQSDNSPSNASSNTPELPPYDSLAKSNISGPMNGTKISDTGAWGNKSLAHSNGKEKEKKRNIFHFRKPSIEQLAPVQAAHPKVVPAQRNGTNRPVFGMQLAEAVEYYPPHDSDVYLPAVVYRCIEYLRAKDAAYEEGIFRLSGSNIVIRSLKDRFNAEGDVDLLAEEDYTDVHAVASLFKTYLRELPSTILTRELHIEFLKVLELDDRKQKIAAFNVLVHQLPAANYSLLRTLSQYLLEVVQNAEYNKMSVKNVGIVFSPTLNIPAPVFAMFLTEFETIFDKPSNGEPIRMTEIDRGGALTPEDIRSPRKQIFTDLPTPAFNQSSFQKNTSHLGGANQTSAMRLSHFQDPSSEVGFAPIQPSYETRQYVTMPLEIPSQPRYPPPQPPHQTNMYGGSNNLMTPENATSIKAKRRESSMLFM